MRFHSDPNFRITAAGPHSIVDPSENRASPSLIHSYFKKGVEKQNGHVVKQVRFSKTPCVEILEIRTQQLQNARLRINVYTCISKRAYTYMHAHIYTRILTFTMTIIPIPEV